ncbi:MAG: type II secretion system protein GspM [Sulfuricellaceae bacterium]|nr:type II secretion system protein GspM [Sulfuricellaceae bacterium]
MKAMNLTPRQSTQLAVVLLLAVILLMSVAVSVPFIWAHSHYNQAIDEKTDLLNRYQRVGAMRQGLNDQIEAIKAKDARKLYLKNTVPALAASEIQEAAKAVIESNGGKIVSMQIQEHKDDGRFRKIGINIQMAAGIASLQKIVHALETRQPYLIIDNMAIRNMVWMAKSAAAANPDYTVQFDLSGFAIQDAK